MSSQFPKRETRDGRTSENDIVTDIIFSFSKGEYIFSLKDLKYHLFAQVVKERFGHLCWEDDLLGLLHCLVNSSSATP